MIGSARVGVDIGGTFTDIVVLEESGKLRQMKLPTTHHAYSEAITTGLAEIIAPHERNAIALLVHGTTVATNAILEQKESSIALITTRGFRDVLELRRARRPDLYSLSWRPPPVLVPRERRFEVRERVATDGSVLEPLDLDDLDRVIGEIRARGYRAVAICLLNSYANAAHEIAIAERVAAALPGVKVTYSAAISPEPNEYERTSTTAVNAFLLPIVQDYLVDLREALRRIDITAAPEVMQSDGTTASASLVGELPCLIIESGPAAGVVAAARLARELGERQVIAFDMGGTTAKASLVEDFRVSLAEELEVGEQYNRGGGHLRGSGYSVRTPCVDLTEVGSGGGSIAWLDGGGALRVGPESTGSMPGPACYGNGGMLPTVTDAHVVLGYLNPVAIAGGRKTIHKEAAERAIGTLAEKMGLSVLDTAFAIYTVATTTMRRAVRTVSVERGRDPRSFTLYAFGGGGGLHAAALAAELDMKRIVVPIAPGLFSSLGLLLSDVAVTRLSARRTRLDAASVAALDAEVDRLAADAAAELRRHHGENTAIVTEAFASVRYVGQSSSLTIRLRADGELATDPEQLARRFHDEHRRVFGQAADGEPVEMVALRARALHHAPETRFADLAAHYINGDPERAATQLQARQMYFGPARGLHHAPVLPRAALSGTALVGPLVVEASDSTIVVPPGFTATLHPSGAVVMDVL